MSYFSDRVKIKVGEEETTIAIRSSESRVDEYTFARDVFDQMIQAINWESGAWEGPEDIQCKIQEPLRRVSLAIRLGKQKREVHRLDFTSFRLMVSQYHSQAKG